jgi:hypothetical protein
MWQHAYCAMLFEVYECIAFSYSNMFVSRFICKGKSLLKPKN